MLKRIKEAVERSDQRRKQSEYEAIDAAVEAGQAVKLAYPISRPNMWPHEVIEEKYIEQAGKCAETGQPLDEDFEVDHDIPYCYGGGNESANTRLTNKVPNRKKANSVEPGRLIRYLEGRILNGR